MFSRDATLPFSSRFTVFFLYLQGVGEEELSLALTSEQIDSLVELIIVEAETVNGQFQ